MKAVLLRDADPEGAAKQNEFSMTAYTCNVTFHKSRTRGTLFHVLYRDLNLNTPEEEARLRKLEKEKSSKK